MCCRPVWQSDEGKLTTSLISHQVVIVNHHCSHAVEVCFVQLWNISLGIHIYSTGTNVKEGASTLRHDSTRKKRHICDFIKINAAYISALTADQIFSAMIRLDI